MCPPVQNSEGTSPPEIVLFTDMFKQFTQLFIFKIFKIKWPKSEEKSEFESRWVWQTRIHPPPPSQNFAAAPLVPPFEILGDVPPRDIDFLRQLSYHILSGAARLLRWGGTPSGGPLTSRGPPSQF